jgi:hypothetical protein
MWICGCEREWERVRERASQMSRQMNPQIAMKMCFYQNISTLPAAANNVQSFNNVSKRASWKKKILTSHCQIFQQLNLAPEEFMEQSTPSCSAGLFAIHSNYNFSTRQLCKYKNSKTAFLKIFKSWTLHPEVHNVALSIPLGWVVAI